MTFSAEIYVEKINPYYFENIAIETPSFFNEDWTTEERIISTTELIIFTDKLYGDILQAKEELIEGVFLTHNQIFD